MQINRRENLRENVLLKYRRAATKVSEVTLDVGKARAAYIHKQNKRNAARIVGSAARLQSAELHRDSLRNLYVTFSGGELAENLLQVIAPVPTCAVTPVSERR